MQRDKPELPYVAVFIDGSHRDTLVRASDLPAIFNIKPASKLDYEAWLKTGTTPIITSPVTYFLIEADCSGVGVYSIKTRGAVGPVYPPKKG